MSRRSPVVVAALVAFLGLAACKGEPAPSSPPDAAQAPTPPAAGADVAPAAAADAAPAAAEEVPLKSPLDEQWAGMIDLPTGQSLAFTVRLVGEAGAPARGTIDIPAQGVQAMALRDVRAEGETRSFTLAVPGPEVGWARFSARVESDGLAKGTLKQGLAELPVTLRATSGDAADAAAADPAPPQTPRPPFPYAVREVAVTAPDGATLAGTLTVPEGDGPHPAVVLLTGSGPQDRDETLFGHKPFLLIADHLTRLGVAVLRLDDRGVGGSTGDLAQATLEVLAADARAALAFLKTQPGIDATRLGLLGHSEGAFAATLAAVPPTEATFVVMLAGSGLSGAEILRSQTETMMRRAGASEAAVAAVLAQHAKVLDAVRTGADAATLRAAVDALVDLQLAEDPQTAANLTPEMRAQLSAAHADALASPALRAFIAHDPRASLGRLEVPVLALFGEKDIQVPPETSLPTMREVLTAAGHADATLEVVPGANHLFQTSTGGGVEEYGTIRETMKPEVLTRVSDWIRAKVGLTALAVDPPADRPREP